MHNRLKGIDGKTVLKILRYFGFQFDRQTGSYQQWKRMDSPKLPRVTVDGNAKSFGKYRTRELVLEAWDRLFAATATS